MNSLKVSYSSREATLELSVQYFYFVCLFIVLTDASISYDDRQVSHISYNGRDYQSVCKLFLNRKRLHVQCYQDPDVAIIEEM